MRPQRSIRLEKRSAKSLDTLSGSSGEIFYDVDSATLRIYTNNANEKVILATRSWTTAEIENKAFSGLYADLIGAPTALSSFTNNVGYITLADLPPSESGGATVINDLIDVEIDTPAAGQLLEYDGSKWINTTVAGLTDTNTTYSLDLTSTTNGVELDLVDSNTVSDIITLLGGTGITVSVTNTNEVTIDNTGSAPAMNDITDVTVALPQDGHVLQYNSGLWINTAPTDSGLSLTDFSITTNPASGEGSLSYNNANGVFTFTPPDVSAAGIELSDLSVLTSTANAGGSLTYNNTTGEFTFRPADLSGLSADLVNDTTPQLGGDLELNTNDIVGSGNIDITGAGTFTAAISAPEFINTGVGAPVITSASTVTLTAPDGVTITDDGTNSVVVDAGNITLDGSVNAGGITVTQGADSVQISDEEINFGSGGLIISPLAVRDVFEISGRDSTSELRFRPNSNTRIGSIIADGDLICTGTKQLPHEPLKYYSSIDGNTPGDLTLNYNEDNTPNIIYIPGGVRNQNATLNLTNLPTSGSEGSNRSWTYTLIIGGTTGGPEGSFTNIVDSVSINGDTNVPLYWANGEIPTKAQNDMIIMSFTIIRTLSQWIRVIGSAVPYAQAF